MKLMRQSWIEPKRWRPTYAGCISMCWHSGDRNVENYLMYLNLLGQVTSYDHIVFINEVITVDTCLPELLEGLNTQMLAPLAFLGFITL